MARDPKSIVREFYDEVINRRNVGAIDHLLSEDFRHNGEARGRAGQRQAVEDFLNGFSDLRHEILIILAEADLVSAHQRWAGTFDGTFLGHEPNGRFLSFSSTAILQVRGDEICQAWDVVDIGLAAQLAQ